MALRGIFLILFALIALFATRIVLLTIVILFSIILIISGILLLYEGFTSGVSDQKPLRFIDGILNILSGIFILLLPVESIVVIMMFISGWAFVSGAVQIAAAIKLRKIIEHELLTITGGLVSIVFSIAILLNLIAGAQALVMLFGIFSLISGILLIGLSVKVKRLTDV